MNVLNQYMNKLNVHLASSQERIFFVISEVSAKHAKMEKTFNKDTAIFNLGFKFIKILLF